MPLTRADKIQIDEYVKNGQIHNARRMLQEDDSVEAKKVLEKLDKRYPPQANIGFDKSVVTPAPRLSPPPRPILPTPSPVIARPQTIEVPADLRQDEMEEIKQAIRDKRYDDARSMLIISDHPDADKMLERLDKVGGGEKVKRTYEADDVDLTAKFQITFFLLIFLTVFGLIALGIFVPEAKKYPNAPGAGGLLLMNKIVRFILYTLLISVGTFLGLVVIASLGIRR